MAATITTARRIRGEVNDRNAVRGHQCCGRESGECLLVGGQLRFGDSGRQQRGTHICRFGQQLNGGHELGSLVEGEAPVAEVVRECP